MKSQGWPSGPRAAATRYCGFVARGVADAVEFKPGYRADVCRSDAVAHGIGQIQLDETGDRPNRRSAAFDRQARRVSSPRRGLRIRPAAAWPATNQKPIFFFVPCGSFEGSFSSVTWTQSATARPTISTGTPRAELIEARLRAPRLDAKIGGDFGAAAGLHGHRQDLLEQFCAALPQRRFHQIAAFDPAQFAGGGAHLDAVVAAGDYVDAVAVVQRVQRLAHLRDAAPKSGGAFADVGFAQRFMLGPEEPGQQPQR